VFVSQLLLKCEVDFYLLGFQQTGQPGLVGFTIIDLPQKNIWALFVHPDCETKGIGKSQHNKMLNWYFSKFHLPYGSTQRLVQRLKSFIQNRACYEERSFQMVK
jgi:GNAT superfamily N-acetyltransferase